MLFHPSDYLALPDCLEEKELSIGAGRKAKIDLAAIKLNRRLLLEYFRSLPAYESWADFLPFVDGNEFLARVSVLVGNECGAWDLNPSDDKNSYVYPRIHRASLVPKPSRGDLEETRLSQEQEEAGDSEQQS